MLSSAYQQSSLAPAASAKIDPDNRLYGHMNRKRLEAEALRDSLLSAAGTLDLTEGGPAVRDFNAPRRSLYIITIRSDRTGFSSLFDTADSTGQVDKRTVSVVAPQALFLMNDPFVTAIMRKVATNALNDKSSDDGSRIDRLYRILYGRPVRRQELKIGLDYLAKTGVGNAAINRPAEDGKLKRWESFCQILLCANEFMYID